MFNSDCLNVNALGHLTVGGKDTVELAARYGTPLYVMDGDEIRRACRRKIQADLKMRAFLRTALVPALPGVFRQSKIPVRHDMVCRG